MKRFAMAALAVLTLFGLASCDLLGSTSSSSTPPAGANLSQWWIKGSFDNWAGPNDQDAIAAGTTVHYLTIDSLNPNLLTYEMTAPAGLKTFTYEFVIMNDGPAGSRVKFQGSSSTAIADNTSYNLVASTTAGSANASFVASATTYTVQVDISTPTAPKLKLIPGSTASVHYTAAELASNLKLAGGNLSMGWTETPGTFDGNHTVSWTNVGATQQSSPVYFHGDVGYFKSAGPIASPQTVSGTVTAALSGSSDQNLTNIPFSDAKYTFDVAIDPNATSFGAAFTLTLTLTAGSTPWTFSPWTSVYIVGSDPTIVGDWSLAGTGPFTVSATPVSGIATFHVTPATSETLAFQLTPGAAWAGQKGFGSIDVDAASLPLTGNAADPTGNISVALTGGTSYTITVDFTTANYIANGKPTVKIVTP